MMFNFWMNKKKKKSQRVYSHDRSRWSELWWTGIERRVKAITSRVSNSATTTTTAKARRLTINKRRCTTSRPRSRVTTRRPCSIWPTCTRTVSGCARTRTWPNDSTTWPRKQAPRRICRWRSLSSSSISCFGSRVSFPNRRRRRRRLQLKQRHPVVVPRRLFQVHRLLLLRFRLKLPTHLLRLVSSTRFSIRSISANFGTSIWWLS